MFHFKKQGFSEGQAGILGIKAAGIFGERGGYPAHLDPELLVEGAGDEAALEQDDAALLRARGHLEVQVLAPVPQLSPLQRLHVEVGTLDLPTVPGFGNSRGI